MDTAIQSLQLLYPAIDTDVLNLIKDAVEEEFLTITHRDEVPEGASSLLISMAREQINKLGAEGLTSETAGVVSLGYVDGYSANVQRQINTYRKIRTV